MNVIESIQNELLSFIKHYFTLTKIPESLVIDLNTDENKSQFGDLNCNAALILAPELKKNPREIAQEIAQNFSHPYIDSMEVAGPGFLNIFLTNQAYKTLAQNIFIDKTSFFQPGNTIRIPQDYSLEFVSANPTGPLHLGHGRGGIIGDVLGNILRFLKNHVTKEYYINDAGAQMQKLGRSFKIRCQQELGQRIEMPEDSYHGIYLVDLAHECVKEFGPSILEKDDSFFISYAKQHLLAHIRHTLEEYGIFFDVWFSEKTLHEDSSITKAIDILEQKGYTYKDEGALWFKSTEFGDDKDRVLRKANGQLTYVAADIAYMLNKFERGATKLIMVLGQDHHSYVQRLKGILEALGRNPDDLTVILYQLVTLKEQGKQLRMSKRAGKMVTLRDIIETVGKDVARFFYLNKKADAHLDFDIDLALKHTDENPVYYIQYAYVRTKSILQNAQSKSAFADYTATDLEHIGPDEYMIIKKILSLKSLLKDIGHNYQTHLLAHYTFELAQAFHKYYSKYRIIDPENIQQSRARLALTQIIKETFELCLSLLGISKPEKM